MLFLATSKYMKGRDVIIGFIFLVILIAGALWIFRNRNQRDNNLPTPTSTISERVNSAFPSLKVPEGADRADMNNVSGGEGLGVATRQKTNIGYSVTVMANLPTPNSGNYIAELSDGSTKITLGRLTETKSGYLVNFSSAQDLSSYNKVTVKLDNASVLEGSFPNR